MGSNHYWWTERSPSYHGETFNVGTPIHLGIMQGRLENCLHPVSWRRLFQIGSAEYSSSSLKRLSFTISSRGSIVCKSGFFMRTVFHISDIVFCLLIRGISTTKNIGNIWNDVVKRKAAKIHAPDEATRDQWIDFAFTAFYLPSCAKIRVVKESMKIIDDLIHCWCSQHRKTVHRKTCQKDSRSSSRFGTGTGVPGALAIMRRAAIMNCHVPCNL